MFDWRDRNKRKRGRDWAILIEKKNMNEKNVHLVSTTRIRTRLLILSLLSLPLNRGSPWPFKRPIFEGPPWKAPSVLCSLWHHHLLVKVLILLISFCSSSTWMHSMIKSLIWVNEEIRWKSVWPDLDIFERYWQQIVVQKKPEINSAFKSKWLFLSNLSKCCLRCWIERKIKFKKGW